MQRLLALVALPWATAVHARLPHGAVAAASPEAAQAGAEILAPGGNAVDAAVAVSLAPAVTEPAGSGPGGQTSMILMAPGRAPVVLNGTSVAPAATLPAASRDQLEGGHTATTVPSTLKTLAFARKRYGSSRIAWADLVAPAIRHAEQVFTIGPVRARSTEELRALPAARALFLAPDGALPVPDAIVRQPTLARTLRRIARHEAQDFYTGAFAREIAAAP